MRRLLFILSMALTVQACSRPRLSTGATLSAIQILPTATLTPPATQWARVQETSGTPEPQLFVDEAMIVRSGPGVNYDVVATIPPLIRYPVIGQSTDWWLIEIDEGLRGWVYAPVNITNFIGDPQRVPQISPPPTPTKQPTPICQPMTTIPTDASTFLEEARRNLIHYFDLLFSGDYQQASLLYDGDYDILREWNPLVPPTDFPTLFRHGCEINGLQCLQVARIVEETVVSPWEISFTVEFRTAEGGLFEIGPCCGADPTTWNPVSQFTYTVIGDCHGRQLVMGLPPYIP
jgi:hypothetical protein